MMELIPYVEVNGVRSIPDDGIRAIFEKMVADGVHRTVFFGEEVKTPTDFLVMAKKPGNVLHVIFDSGAPVWVSWVNMFGFNYASGHFCAFKEIWGKKTAEAAGMTLRYWFGWENSGKPLLDVIFGRIPACNHQACKFIERIGFTKMGVVPLIAFGPMDHQKVGCAMYYITRDEVI